MKWQPTEKEMAPKGQKKRTQDKPNNSNPKSPKKGKKNKGKPGGSRSVGRRMTSVSSEDLRSRRTNAVAAGVAENTVQAFFKDEDLEKVIAADDAANDSDSESSGDNT